jgi:hypothetical protein
MLSFNERNILLWYFLNRIFKFVFFENMVVFRPMVLDSGPSDEHSQFIGMSLSCMFVVYSCVFLV